jgi:hypothetical protein
MSADNVIAALAAAAVLSSQAAVSAQASARSTADLPDRVAGKQVHAVYALPRDGIDRQLDTNGTIANEIASFQAWLQTQTAGAPLIVDMSEGGPDITFFKLRKTDAQVAASGAGVLDVIEAELRAAGFGARRKIYALWYDGSSVYACGGGGYPRRAAAMYLHGRPPGAPPCDGNPFAVPGGPPGYLAFAMLHEILHTIGIVPTCAPHEVRFGHVSDSPTDLMYAGDQPWNPSVLDIGRDDYFGAHIPKCLDLATSGWLQGPALARLRLSPRAFGAVRTGARAIGRAVGTRISYAVSQRATTTFTIARATPGRRRGSTCVPARRRPQRRSCTRWKRVAGSFSHADSPGANQLRFTGRMRGQALRRGRYRLSARPANAAGVTGRVVAARFRITG